MKNLLDKHYKDMLPTAFQFELSKKATQHNSNIIEEHGFDLESALESNSKDTHLMYGSEFQPASDLSPLLKYHELWERTQSILTNGAIIPLEEMDSAQEKEDLVLGLKRGNHKGAVKQEKLLK